MSRLEYHILSTSYNFTQVFLFVLKSSSPSLTFPMLVSLLHLYSRPLVCLCLKEPLPNPISLSNLATPLKVTYQGNVMLNFYFHM